jgi:uncharacterized protein YodC (DUF2158 family)
VKRNQSALSLTILEDVMSVKISTKNQVVLVDDFDGQHPGEEVLSLSRRGSTEFPVLLRKDDASIELGRVSLLALHQFIGSVLSDLSPGIQVGDVVEFNNGLSPDMTVAELGAKGTCEEGLVKVQWFNDDDQLHEALLSVALLQVVAFDEEEE